MNWVNGLSSVPSFIVDMLYIFSTKDCPILIILNGNLSTRAISSGTTVTVSCNPTYKLSGSSSLTCYDGSWSGGTPVCRKGM